MNHLTKKYAQNVCYLEMNRPEKRNALNKELMVQLTDYLKSTADSNQFRVLMISGSNHFFSAGADLAWMKEGREQNETQNLEDAELFNQLYRTLSEYPKPIIACVEGGAYGGAIGLLACADIVTTTPDATFRFSETAIGLVPATVAPWVIRKTGSAFARSALLSGLSFSGTEALSSGLVQYLFPKDKIVPKTREIANQIARNSPEATKETKNLLNRIDHQFVPIDEDLTQYCSTKIARARISDQGQEGVNAFFEKRKPSWNN
ncbi:enoyl-CoA hydratase/isomerase family protein [Marinilabilia salmonicolor]|jgi:methylglutaconyl-CoA hydratase|uniref:Short chain enoyl-CoA hydratase n=1 Tax=Marinilabilia salmonicolor TaxID=989 RepID=A0A2T0XMR6_9BACT|nr:enoyl-CoA hydratase-related protein [Marinilabilia salmonicolor]PRZ00239.1 methylglutaconyl-CoA hydratase [Marinilabilia salmonicolor]RCW38304.1 short chain enoyl-CoA hydratase [Marinilabilia salmonicolor]